MHPPKGELQGAALGAPTYNPRPQANIIFSLDAKCSSGLTFAMRLVSPCEP